MGGAGHTSQPGSGDGVELAEISQLVTGAVLNNKNTKPQPLGRLANKLKTETPKTKLNPKLAEQRNPNKKITPPPPHPDKSLKRNSIVQAVVEQDVPQLAQPEPGDVLQGVGVQKHTQPGSGTGVKG